MTTVERAANTSLMVRSRCLTKLALLCAVLCTAARGQTQLPPKGTAYVLPDGTIRVVGSAAMEGVIAKLNALFVQTHPGLRFKYESADNNGAIDALIFEATPFAPVGTVYGGSIAYSDIVKAAPFAVRVAHGSLNPQAKVSPLAVVVNPANPVSQLSVADVAAMFTKQVRARVLSTWGQAGMTGAAAAMAIETAGLPWSDHYASEDRAFGDDVFFRKFGGAAPVDTYQMFKTYADVVDYVAREPGAVGIVQLNKVTPAVKVVGLVEGQFGKARTGSADDVRSGHYPLDRYLYLHARAQNGKPLDPMVLEYLRMVLSPEGQSVIAKEGEDYLPLNAIEIAEEQAKFE